MARQKKRQTMASWAGASSMTRLSKLMARGSTARRRATTAPTRRLATRSINR
jgi:hypothetical protein